MAAHEVFSDAELDRLRGFPELTRLDLIRFFTLSPADAEFVSARRGDQNRLGLAVQLATLLWLGFVPDDVEAAPLEAVARLAGVLGVDPAVLSGYGRRGQTRTEHLRVAVAHLGWRTADRADWKGVDEFLSARAMERDSPRLLFSAACDLLRAGRVVRPGVVTILKRVAAARDRAGDETWVRLSGLLTARWREVLDGLLVIDPGLGGSRLEWLQRGPVTASAGTIRSELAKLAFLRGIGADRLDLSMLAMERRRFLAGIARRSSSPALARRDPFRRYPILLASVAQSAIDVLDEVVGLFDQALSARESHAKARLTEHLADRARHSVDRDALLDEILEVVLDESFDDATVGTMLRRDIGMVRMQAAQDARPQPLPRDRGHLGLLAESFPYIRQFAPAVLTNVTFKASSNAGEVLAAVEILTGLYRSGIVAVPDDAPVGFIPTRWQGYLRAAKAARDTARYRRYWELCTLLALRDGLRCGDVFVPGSRRYADPTSFLITPQRWTPERAEYCDLIGRPADPSAALRAIDVELHEALADLDQGLAAEPETGRVRVDDNGDLVVPALSAEAVPPEAGQLGHALEAILPNVQFASLLVEIDARTGLLDELVHAGGRTNRPPDLKRNLIYVLIAEATNIGLAAMARSSGVAYDTLVWTADWYLQPDTLERANHALVNYHHQLPGAALFGTGTMSSSDGQRFPVRGRSLNARHLSRYFANGQGISTYTHVTDQHSTFATRVIVATASESHYVLDDALGNAADLPIIEHTTDTHGATLANFALFDLVGLRLSPRIRDLGKITLCRTTTRGEILAAYPHAGRLLTRRANTELIAHHWDDLLRVAASVKHGHTSAALVVGKLCSSARQQSSLAAAMKEYGTIRRTIHTARYLTDETMRRRVLRQLNKGENLHGLRRTIAYASGNGLNHRTHEQQTEQMWCLTIATNAVVTWITECFARALDTYRQTGRVIDDAHLAHIWPTRHTNISFHGVHHIDINDELAQLTNNGYRPVRALADQP